MTEKFEFIDAERAAAAQAAELPTVVRMCALLEVSKSGFYEWRHRPVSAAQRRRELLAEKIGALFETFDATYGYRRIHAELVRAGERVGPELVRKLMREMGLIPVQPKPFRTTTELDPHAPDTVDLVKRDFTAQRPGTKVVSDITYIRTWQGWLYLASLIDCCTREVIGYAMAEHMRTKLVLDAVDMAMRNGRLEADCIMHSDRGTHAIHVGRIPGKIGRARVAPFGRADRSMLGQRARGIVFREFEERAGPSYGVSDPKGGNGGYCALHRVVLQLPTNSFRTRLPDTARSPHRVPEFTARRVNGHEICSPGNAGQPKLGRAAE